MGMFDRVIINIEKLPLSHSEKQLMYDASKNDIEFDFQTKDFENVLTEIYITDDGLLQINDWELESVPLEERPHSGATGLMQWAGSIRRVNERLVTQENYTGVVNFYAYFNEKWFEFNATFIYGKLDKIERVFDDNEIKRKIRKTKLDDIFGE
jgi:hypothetical protein